MNHFSEYNRFQKIECVLVADTIRAELQQARRLSSPSVPLIWLHRRNWDFAVRLLPERYAADARAAIRIATTGMDIIFQGNTRDLPRATPNLVFSEQERLYVDCDFIEELWRGRTRVAGSEPVYGQVRLLTVAKDATKIRLCRDATHKGSRASINTNMPQEAKSVSFARFTDLVRQARAAGPTGWMFCADGDAWFRQFAVTPFAEDMLYYRHRGEGYHDLREPFGPANAPRDAQIMSSIAAAVAPRWFLPERPDLADSLCSYIDDFWAFASSLSDIWLLVWAFLSAFWFLGLGLSFKKFQPPAQTMKILGFVFDLPTQSVRIPDKKIRKALNHLSLVLDSQTTTRKQVERLLGLLQWISAVAFPLRAMLRQSYADLALFPPADHAPVILHRDTREQLEWWRRTLPELNWRPFDHILGFEHDSITNVTSDASGEGFGIWWDDVYVQYRWRDCPAPWSALEFAHINTQEAFALVAAAAVLEFELAGRYVRFITDNATVYWAWEKLSSDSRLVMASVRMVARSAIRHKYRWFAGWIGTKDNRLADALSRSQWALIDGLVDLSRKQRRVVPFGVLSAWLREEPAWARQLDLSSLLSGH